METIEKKFQTIEIKTIKDNVFKLIDNDWMLITAGNPEHFNTMTASWGTMGILWNKPIAVCFIRPHRYTFDFAEKSAFYTLSFFDAKYKSILNICGTKSGRDIDKVKETGLTPLISKNGNIGYHEARMIIECRKIYSDYIKEDNFIFPKIAVKNYPSKDFHKFYIGEVMNCFMK